MRAPSFSLLPLTAVLVAALGLAACDRKPEQATVGQQIDSAVAKVEQKTDATMATVGKRTDAAVATVEQKTEATVAKIEQKTGEVMDSAKLKVKDATITTRINAELARDKSLSALKINVDTHAGRVALKGSAPDATSRDRATELAQRVDGVVGVDNQLEIRSN